MGTSHQGVGEDREPGLCMLVRHARVTHAWVEPVPCTLKEAPGEAVHAWRARMGGRCMVHGMRRGHALQLRACGCARATVGFPWRPPVLIGTQLGPASDAPCDGMQQLRRDPQIKHGPRHYASDEGSQGRAFVRLCDCAAVQVHGGRVPEQLEGHLVGKGSGAGAAHPCA